MNADGTGLRPLAKDMDRPGPVDIWVARVDGSDQRNLTRSPDGVDNFGLPWGPPAIHE